VRIGIDLGGTKIEGIALDDAGKALERNRIATPAGDYGATLQAIAGLVARIESRCGAKGTIGIATPGSVSRTRGVMRNANSVCLNGRALQEDLQQLLARPVRTANDADCFALSEAVDGSGRGASVVFGVILGTGTGGASWSAALCFAGRMPSAASGDTTPYPGRDPTSWTAGHVTAASTAA